MNMFAKALLGAVLVLPLVSPASAVTCAEGQGVEVKLDLNRNPNGSVKVPESIAITSPNVRRVSEVCDDGKGWVKIPAAPNSDFVETGNAGDAVYHMHMALKKGLNPEDATAFAKWLAEQTAKAEPRLKETAATAPQPDSGDDWRVKLFGTETPTKK